MTSERTPKKGLEYFISEKGDFLVLSLMGSITKAGARQFEQCKTDLRNSAAKNVIISLHDVPKIDLGGIPPFIQLQLAIRQNQARLRLCFVRPELQKFLIERAAVRQDELMTSLRDALQSFKKVR